MVQTPDQKLDIQWAAGFFEGEGSAYVRKHIKIGKLYPCLSLQIAQVYKEPLDAFLKIVELGVVRGPYGPYGGNRQPHYQYAVNGQDAVIVAEMLIPLMFQKGEQVREATDYFMEYWNARKAA